MDTIKRLIEKFIGITKNETPNEELNDPSKEAVRS